MTLEFISILHYKNIEHAELTLSPKINCFLGKNAMGKTNILDAVYFLSFCKSHTNFVDSQNIMFGQPFALLQGRYAFANTQPKEVTCSIQHKQRKQVKVNKKEYERLSDHIGVLPLVLVSPTDSELIAGGSEDRRKFVNMILSQFDKDYLHALVRYNKALTQRNTMLKGFAQNDPTLLEIWEIEMAKEATILYKKRLEFLTAFTPIFQKYYNHISGANEKVHFSYRSQLHDGEILSLMGANRHRDILLGYTSVGIHKDDLEMLLDDHPIKRVGSQGQNKTFLIALKFAQFELIKQMSGIKPILLLDDIFDKLDAFRVKQIIELVSQEEFGQILITDTNREHLDSIITHTHSEFHLHQVSNGRITPL